MKKLIVSALVAGTFLFGTVYAQTSTTAPASTPAKPVQKKEAVAPQKAEKPATASSEKSKHKGKGHKKSETSAPAKK